MSHGRDGASVMIGSGNGLASKISKLNPHTVPVQCCYRRLNLSVSDVCKRHADVEVRIHFISMDHKAIAKLL